MLRFNIGDKVYVRDQAQMRPVVGPKYRRIAEGLVRKIGDHLNIVQSGGYTFRVDRKDLSKIEPVYKQVSWFAEGEFRDIWRKSSAAIRRGQGVGAFINSCYSFLFSDGSYALYDREA